MADLNLIKKLREQTGCGIADCNKALAECGNDIEASRDWLRKKGLSSAAKKTTRVASEGLIAVQTAGTSAVIIEVNSETDFVSKNTKFQDFCRGLLAVATDLKDQYLAKYAKDGENITNAEYLEKIKGSIYKPSGRTVVDEIVDQISSIGENINFRHARFLSVESGVVAKYIHTQVADGMGKIGVLVALESKLESKEKLEELGKKIAMHIAAAKPEVNSIGDVSPEKLARERDIFAEQARTSGKPDSVIEKMIDGRIRKYYDEVVLLEQIFVMDGKTKISELVKSSGADIVLKGFALLVLGDGIDKEANNFADEVAQMSSAS